MVLILLSENLYSQTFNVFDIETSSFPVVKAKFYAFDSTGTQITNLSPSDFEITENGEPRKVLSVSCPKQPTLAALSSVLVIDASGSMGGRSGLMAKAGAMAWLYGLPLGKSECALTSFNTRNYFICDFTKDRNRLSNEIIFILSAGGTDFEEALINPMAGGILVAKTGKYKKVVVMLTDGQPNFEPNTQEIIRQAKQDNIIVYAVTLLNTCPQCLKDITTQTGGRWFENITSEKEAREVYLNILGMAQAENPCTIEWESVPVCQAQKEEVKVTLLENGISCCQNYQLPESKVAALSSDPSSVKFLNAVKDTCVTVKVTARNADFNITNITATNPAYRVEPPLNFPLKDGESRDLTVCYTPADSGYTYCLFDIENDMCRAKLYCKGGFPGVVPTKKTIKLIQPNGGEVFLAGNDTLITWEGILPDDPVTLEYSTNNGVDWSIIGMNITGLGYKWHIPNTPSNQCLARVTAQTDFITFQEVKICNSIWMDRNLDVDCYRNGEKIRHATTKEDWADALADHEGAWCYYENNSGNAFFYGKLYNQYAIKDLRGLAPEGWHVATKEEWDTLCRCTGGYNAAGGKLKNTGTIEGADGLWRQPNTGATNESGFTAQPGGCIDDQFLSVEKGFYGYWWMYMKSSLAYSKMSFDEASVRLYQSPTIHEYGFSVRCVKD